MRPHHPQRGWPSHHARHQNANSVSAQPRPCTRNEYQVPHATQSFPRATLQPNVQIMVMIALQQGASSASSRLGTTEVRNSSMAKDSRMSFFAASSGPSDDFVWHDASHTTKRLAFIESATSYGDHLITNLCSVYVFFVASSAGFRYRLEATVVMCAVCHSSASARQLIAGRRRYIFQRVSDLRKPPRCPHCLPEMRLSHG